MGLNLLTGELMAVKRVSLPRFLPCDSSNLRGSSLNKLETLHSEVELLRNLNHPNIVRYIGSQVEHADLVILLEYVPGGSITDLLTEHGPLEEGLISSFVKQILDGLDFLHDRNIIHRDIKGGNVLVDNKGHVKISDFGISKQISLEGESLKGRRSSFQGSVYW